jgi:heme-degrading monooxygenase HmoA
LLTGGRNGHDAAVIFEHAVLDVRPGEVADFEAAFAVAKPLIAGAAGFRGLQLLRCMEQSHRFLLLVEWETLGDHVDGFRSSPAYHEWSSLLHQYYEPFPVVEHFEAFHRA